MLGSAIACYTVGLDDAGSQLLGKTIDWLQEAISTNERGLRYSADWTEAVRYLDYALCEWLLSSEHCHESYRHMANHLANYLRAHPKAALERRTAPFVFTPLLDAGAYDTVLSLIKHVSGFNPPKDAEAVIDETQLCYFIARSRATGSAIDEKVIQRSVQRNADVWQRHGLHTHLAEWCKIAFWKEGTDGVSALRQGIQFPPQYFSE